MRYFVTIQGRVLEVDLTGSVPLVDGEPLEAELDGSPTDVVRHMLADGRSYGLVARRLDPHLWSLQLDGDVMEVEVIHERTRAIRALAGQGAAAAGPKPVRAPMPGLVLRVQVEPGDRVAAGQTLLIIEAMKMENDLKADADAVVASVAVTAGQPVEKGALLIEFEADEPEDAGTTGGHG